MYNAVQCTDVQWPTKWSTWSHDNWQTFAKAPFETWGNAWFNAPCLNWPAAAHAKQPMRIDGRQVKSALLIDETLDAATPFEGSPRGAQAVPALELARPARRHVARQLAVRQRLRGRPRSRPTWPTAPCRPANRARSGHDLRAAAHPGTGRRG